jgi:uncharacterized protein (DUF1684 family)
MMRRFVVYLPVFLSLVLLVAGCGQKVESSAPGAFAMDETEHDRWEIALVDMRIEKNEAFSDPAQTPLPADRIADFQGLEYYFPEPALRFKTPFVAEAGTDTVSLTKRQGQVIPYLRKGKVSFTHQGTVHTLAVFGPANPSAGDYLWLPFFDATSGKETYPGGRYLDIEVGDDGMVDLDFNFAYNPLCDYNPDRYNCTLPPMDNTLPFAVEAGEKTLNPGH